MSYLDDLQEEEDLKNDTELGEVLVNDGQNLSMSLQNIRNCYRENDLRLGIALDIVNGSVELDNDNQVVIYTGLYDTGKQLPNVDGTALMTQAQIDIFNRVEEKEAAEARRSRILEAVTTRNKVIQEDLDWLKENI